MGAVLAVLATATMLGQSASTQTQTTKPRHDAHTSAQQEPGERAFQTHCSRCHNAPETLSPRITGTVVRHMRVRANLSAEDERLILSFLNP